MGRTTLGLFVLVVFLFGGYFMIFLKRGTAGHEYRLAAREMIAQVEGYSQRQDYYDWLVDYAHDHVFNNAFKMESRGRRRVETWVDEGKYFDDLLQFMIEHARQDNAFGVVKALQDLRYRRNEAEQGSGPVGAGRRQR
jgi:hypothetical protein